MGSVRCFRRCLLLSGGTAESGAAPCGASIFSDTCLLDDSAMGVAELTLVRSMIPKRVWTTRTEQVGTRRPLNDAPAGAAPRALCSARSRARYTALDERWCPAALLSERDFFRRWVRSGPALLCAQARTDLLLRASAGSLVGSLAQPPGSYQDERRGRGRRGPRAGARVPARVFHDHARARKTLRVNPPMSGARARAPGCDARSSACSRRT